MRSNLAARAMVGVLALAVLVALLAAAVTLTAGAGMLAAAVAYCLPGTTLLTGWTALVFLSERWPPIRGLQLAIHGRRHPA